MGSLGSLAWPARPCLSHHGDPSLPAGTSGSLAPAAALPSARTRRGNRWGEGPRSTSTSRRQCTRTSSRKGVTGGVQQISSYQGCGFISPGPNMLSLPLRLQPRHSNSSWHVLFIPFPWVLRPIITAMKTYMTTLISSLCIFCSTGQAKGAGPALL